LEDFAKKYETKKAVGLKPVKYSLDLNYEI
jgi:hypothetical protein